MRLLLSWLGLAASAATACPIDPGAPAAGAALSVVAPGAPVVRFKLADLAAMPQREIVQRRTLAAAGAAASEVEQAIRYSGPLLKGVIEHGWPDIATRRDGRWFVIETIASDGYRAFFSWGELYNSANSEQTLVILRIDGQGLDAQAGPLALRALADLRPGPRHVRNLCGVVVRSP